MANQDSKINTYVISRHMFDWSFINPDKVKPSHIAIYFYALDLNNRFGWKDKFGFPTLQAMETTGIKSKNTYYKAFHELVEWGFIEIVTKSKNQNTANIISIPAVLKFKSANDTADMSALDLANIRQEYSEGNIDKQLNNKTIKKENIEGCLEKTAYEILKEKAPSWVEQFEMRVKKQIQDYETFKVNFEYAVEKDNISFDHEKLLKLRLEKLFTNWDKRIKIKPKAKAKTFATNR